MNVGNIFNDIPDPLSAEDTRVILDNGTVRVERIVSRGHCSSQGFWYDQDDDEWVVVLRGAARLRFEDRTLELKAGDSVFIAAHSRHRVDWTTPDEDTIWLAVFYGGGRETA